MGQALSPEIDFAKWMIITESMFIVVLNVINNSCVVMEDKRVMVLKSLL